MTDQPGEARTLVLLRHAKSDWSAGEIDVRRPLKPRGRRQAAEAGRWLADNVGTIDLAVVSPAERATRTWELAAAELSSPPTLRVEDRAYAASERALLGLVRGLPSDRASVVLVGHNPGLEGLLGVLTGRWTAMPTACIAVLELTGPWSSAGRALARLIAFGRPPGDAPLR